MIQNFTRYKQQKETTISTLLTTETTIYVIYNWRGMLNTRVLTLITGKVTEGLTEGIRQILWRVPIQFELFWNIFRKVKIALMIVNLVQGNAHVEEGKHTIRWSDHYTQQQIYNKPTYVWLQDINESRKGSWTYKI